MRDLIRLVVPVLLVLSMSMPLTGQVSQAEIEDAIDRGVQVILGMQAEDGRWPYAPGGNEQVARQVGHTALAVLALQHARSKRTEAHLAIKKGLSFMLQHEPEPLTYTAGLVEQCLYWDSPRQHQKMITCYGWMLCGGQKLDGAQKGSWTYGLPRPPQNWVQSGLRHLGTPSAGRSDNSNSQFGILGLVYAEKAGFQVPKAVWERARDYYIGSQHKDGGWDYMSEAYRLVAPERDRTPRRPTMAMTLAGTVSSYLCEEALADKRHRQCKAPAPNECHEKGLEWIADHWRPTQGAYGWYACERLGILIGYSEFGGHDWFQEGAADLRGAIGSVHGWQGPMVNTAFAVLFLARGRHPIIINKLKREGDWNLHRYDLKNLIEHISGPWQHPSQWRIITLDASVDMLLRVPILWISGHEALNLNGEEKGKLKEYVERGGTILGEACCGRTSFDLSFRELLKELWPDTELRALPKTHAIYTSFRKLTQKPTLMGLPLDAGQGRLGVIYIPHGMSCKWEVAGPRSQPWLDVGACIYLYVDQVNRRMGVRPRAVQEQEAKPGGRVDGFGEEFGRTGR